MDTGPRYFCWGTSALLLHPKDRQDKIMLRTSRQQQQTDGDWKEKITHDRLLSPSLRLSSMIRSISFLPCVASTNFPAMVMLTFCLLFAIKSFFSSKCRICTHTNTPQSLLFFCCGLSAKSKKRNSLPSNCANFRLACSPSTLLAGFRLS